MVGFRLCIVALGSLVESPHAGTTDISTLSMNEREPIHFGSLDICPSHCHSRTLMVSMLPWEWLQKVLIASGLE